MPNLLEASGSHSSKQGRGSAPIFTNRFFLGLWTNRNPLRSPAGVIYENYYHLGGTDVLITGVNVELSNRLTLCRRPGVTAGLTGIISSANVPAIIDSFYSFHEINGVVRIFADTPTAPYLATSTAIIPIFTKAAGVVQSYFQGIAQTLYFTDAKEQEKWLDFGAGNPGNSFATVTNTVLVSNVATYTSVNNFAMNQVVVVSGTTNGSGVFNVTGKVLFANAIQFTLAITNANVGSAAEAGYANGCWNMGIVAPPTSPTLNIVASGSAASVWQVSTIYSTMGLIYDSGTGTIQQLVSVNALGGNTTQYGTTGNGQPAWSNTPGATTADSTGGGTITWTNWGPIGTWAAGATFKNNAVGGTVAQPCVIYDPTTKHLQANGAPGNASGTTGPVYPHFTGVLGSFIWDGTVKWFDIGAPGTWMPGTNYPAYGLDPILAAHAIVEPQLPPSTSPLYLQASGGGTSGTGYTPAFQTTAGQQVTDNQLAWLSLGSATWTASQNYTQWTGTSPVFSVVQDLNGNLQVCVVTGTSGTIEPLAQWVAGHVYALNAEIVDSNSNVQKVTTNGTSGSSKTLSNTVLTAGVATYTSAAHGFSTGQYVTVTGSTNNAAFNVVNAFIASTTTNTFTVLIAHDNIATGADTGNVKAGPTWNATVAGTTTDGSVVWTNQGAENAGGRPAGWGFKYGDTTPDGTATWVCVGPPVTWASATQWNLPTQGFAPPSAAEPYGGSEVIGSAFVQAVISSGKSAAVTQPSWSIVVGNFVLDPSTVNNQITWRNIAAQSANSISWTTGYGYVYSYKARTVLDQYSPIAGGGLGLVPPGQTQPLGTPTGSADGSVSTASPSIQMAAGPNGGSVVYVSGIGSTDPQVDTIEIYRTKDGGATYYFLTDIKNPSTIGGVAQPWTFEDFIPDNPTNTLPGLNTLVIAPTAHFNDPPPAGVINLVQFFGRLWGSVGSTVYCSEGPLVGGSSQPPGNGFTAWNPGQFWQFPSPVTKLVATPSSLLVFTTSDTFVISGGPQITSFFAYPKLPGLGLTSGNALDVRGTIVDLITSDGRFISLDPSTGQSETGFPVADLIATGISPSTAYVAYHSQGSSDSALFVADGSTGWYRCNPTQSPDSTISGPVWSPKANIVGGCKAIGSLEVAPGQHALLIGSTSANQPILVRDSTFTIFSDAGTAYPANYVFGAIVLSQPGQLAEVDFITCEYQRRGTSPKLAVLLDEIYDSAMTITAATQSGNNTTYSFTLNAGNNSTPQLGDGPTITGMSNAGNNGTFIINSLGAGTFTVTNPSGVTAVGQSGAATMFADLTGNTFAATSVPPQDPPLVYGATQIPTSTYAPRYYLEQSVNGAVPPQGASCRFMEIRIDYGSTDTVQNELLTMTIYGQHWDEI